MVRIGLLVDRSGSMERQRGQVIKSHNTYLDDQRRVRMEQRVSAWTFAESLEERYFDKPLMLVHSWDHPDYNPDGSTNLYDALNASITAFATKVSDSGDQVIFAIITDGYDTGSKVTAQQARALIKAKQAQGWKFIFLGADVKVGSDLGIEPKQLRDIAGAFKQITSDIRLYLTPGTRT